jgi:hypothetical protein
VDGARPAPFLTHELSLFAHALAEPADGFGAEVLQGHSACCGSEHVDSAEDERTGPSAAEIGDSVEELAGGFSWTFNQGHRRSGSGIWGPTHSHIRSANEGIGNLRVERGDPDKLDGTARRFHEQERITFTVNRIEAVLTS